jgi:DNA end-binding protein Ku
LACVGYWSIKEAVMAHPIWNGSISFGLVNIPVGLFSAEGKESKLDFNLLDKKDHAPIGYKKINKRTGQEVAADDMVKGYELEDGSYAVLTDEDFKKANPKATQTVEIIDFVDLKDIHPVFFEKPYYLAPMRRGEKGYALLREALKISGKAGVARVVIHSKEYIGVLAPYGKALVLDLLRYAVELKDPSELGLPDEDLKGLGVTKKELDMAQKLIESMIADWEPGKYHDTYREELLGYIKKKVEAGETARVEEAAPAASPGADVIDIMALLKKSLEETGAARAKKKAAGK